MKNMRQDSTLKNLCPEKNLTYHSDRKAVVKNLKSSGIGSRICQGPVDQRGQQIIS